MTPRSLRPWSPCCSKSLAWISHPVLTILNASVVRWVSPRENGVKLGAQIIVRNFRPQKDSKTTYGDLTSFIQNILQFPIGLRKGRKRCDALRPAAWWPKDGFGNTGRVQQRPMVCGPFAARVRTLDSAGLFHICVCVAQLPGESNFIGGESNFIGLGFQPIRW
jgi:hypothetical protein